MTMQQATTWIFVARATGDEVYSTDQSGEITREQANAVAERFNEQFVARIEAEYPDADIEIGQGNGIDRLKVQDDDGHEDEIVSHLDSIATAIWESDSIWQAAE